MRVPLPSPEPAILRLNLLGPLLEVRSVALATRDFLTRHGWPAPAVAECELALVEACNNALQHQPAENIEPPVSIEILCEAHQAEIRISDRAPEFKWNACPGLPAADCESGRGLFLIHSVMDEVDYVRCAAGNLLVLRKRRKG